MTIEDDSVWPSKMTLSDEKPQEASLPASGSLHKTNHNNKINKKHLTKLRMVLKIKLI